jgi:hypothetical protein
MDIRVHLKVCEACGCLWYRVQAETRVYCASCHDRFKDFPLAQPRRPRGRPKRAALSAVLPSVLAVSSLSRQYASQASMTAGTN